MSNWVSLHSHTDHSLLDSVGSIQAYFDRATELGMQAIGITDHGTMSGHWDAYHEGKRTGIQPILGIEAYRAPLDRFHKSPYFFGREDQRSLDVGTRGACTHMTMLALNSEGLRNMYEMQYYAERDGFYYKPRIDTELMQTYSKGVLVTSGCAGSEVSVKLRLGQWDEAVAAAGLLKDIYGENFFIEVMNHDIDEPDLNDAWLNGQLTKLATHLKVPLIATNDCHYVHANEAKAHDAFLCIQTKKTIADEKRSLKFNGAGYHLRSYNEMLAAARTGNFPVEAIQNTLLVAERVTGYDEVFSFKNRMPHHPDVDPDFENEALREKTFAGLARKGLDQKPEYVERAEYELEVIAKTGFPGYFLVLGDILGWATEQGIRMAPARGSGGGSLVCYANNITAIDPLVHDLPFERFLNLHRVSMPDIDTDFEIHRRDEVVQYAKSRYGEANVAKIMTLIFLKAKAAIKDAARVLGYPVSLADSMSELFPEPIHGFMPDLDVVTDQEHPRYKDAKAFRNLLDQSPEAREVYDLAVKLEGKVRTVGTHAGGLIISSEPLYRVLPTKFVNGELTTGFDQHAMEPLSLIKYDFLGVANLTILENTLRNIEKVYGEQVVLEDLPLDDAKTYKMIAEGNTLGVFQLGEGGAVRLLRKLKPTRFEDICAATALNRPGPMGIEAHWLYADRKNGVKPVDPIHPEFAESLKEVLGPTYQIICYQEQVMKVLQIVAGYSLGEADAVRKVMGKKKPAEMARLEPELKERVMSNGYSEEAFSALWETLIPFSSYGFNKAHSYGYSLVSYWTAYLKANYPIAFFAALLTNEADGIEQVGRVIKAAREMGVQILPPDVNESEFDFTPTKKGIRFGLSAIKGVGAAVITAVTRNKWDSLEHFYSEIDDKVNSRALQALVASGTFDSFGDRSTHWEMVPIWIEKAKAAKKARQNGDLLLIEPQYPLPEDQTNPERMRAWEQEIVGTVLTLPQIKVQMAAPLDQIRWAWVRDTLAGHPGTEQVCLNLQGVSFTTGLRVSPSAKLVKQLNVLEGMRAELT